MARNESVASPRVASDSENKRDREMKTEGGWIERGQMGCRGVAGERDAIKRREEDDGEREVEV